MGDRRSIRIDRFHGDRACVTGVAFIIPGDGVNLIDTGSEGKFIRSAEGETIRCGWVAGDEFPIHVEIHSGHDAVRIGSGRGEGEGPVNEDRIADFRSCQGYCRCRGIGYHHLDSFRRDADTVVVRRDGHDFEDSRSTGRPEGEELPSGGRPNP